MLIALIRYFHGLQLFKSAATVHKQAMKINRITNS